MASRDTKYARLLLSTGVTSKEVTKGTGFKKGYVSMIKNGYQNITMNNLKKLCLFHKCTPNDILEYEKWFEEAEAKKAAKAAKSGS